MQDVLYIDELEQAAALLKPLRIELLQQLGEPRTLSELGAILGETPQKLYYHVKVLERAGLVEKVDERRVGGIIEGFYQAAARSYWLSPALVGQVGGRRRAEDQLSLAYLLGLAEDMHNEIGHLAEHAEADTASLGLAAQIYLPDGNRRAAFLAELQQTIQALATKYGAPSDPVCDPGTFRLMLACYPAPRDQPLTGNRVDDRVIDERGT
jgi:DNA-binding transcriptional ArsR family regulator